MADWGEEYNTPDTQSTLVIFLLAIQLQEFIQLKNQKGYKQVIFFYSS